MVWVITCSSPAPSVMGWGVETATRSRVFQVLTACRRELLTARSEQFLTVVCTVISPRSMCGAIWIVWINGLSQQISETLS